MKIGVASDDRIHVTGHLGRCEGFWVYNIEDKKITRKEYRPNTFTNHRMGGHHEHEHDHEHQHGHSHGNLISGLGDCSYLIFQSGGRRVVEDLKSAGIQPVLTNEPVADEAVQKFIDGILDIKEDNVCTAH